MPLFHLHTLDSHDELYAPNKEIIVDNSFNNRMYDSIYTNLNPSYTAITFPETFSKINRELENVSNKEIKIMNLDEIINFIKFFGCSDKELKTLFNISSTLLQQQRTALDELAYERCRETNFSDRPSRLHSMFACSEEGIQYWLNEMKSKRVDVYQIEVEQEPFLTNPSLLPDSHLYLCDKVIAARKYFNPVGIREDDHTNEYLVRGRVILKDKIMEVRK